MNNIDVDDVRCDKDEYGNLLPFKPLVKMAADENSAVYFGRDEPEDPEESYWW
mgnify:CR=1 FL=1